jgi:DNA polymerase III sliding clamp (beta) subunit (PCNA family)
MAEREAQEGTIFVLDITKLPKLKNGSLFMMSRTHTTKGREKEIQISFDGIVQTVKELDVNTVRYPRIPPVSYGDESVTAEIRLEPLRKFMAVARDISDAVTFTAHREDIITVSAEYFGENDDHRKAEIVLDRDNGDLLDFRMNRGLTAIKGGYPLEYIEKTVKAIIATEIEISWKTDYPMTAIFKLPPVAKKNKGHYPTGVIPVRFMLAPRMSQ